MTHHVVNSCHKYNLKNKSSS